MTAADDFTYSDGALPTVSSGAWVASMGLDIAVVSTHVEGSVDEQGQTAYYAGTWANNHFSQATLAWSGTTVVGLAVRASGAGGSAASYLFFTVGTSDTRMQKVVSGFGVDIVTGITTPATGSVIKMTATGNTIKVYDDTVEIASYTDLDEPLAGGAPGIFFYRLPSGTGTIDDWSGEDMGAVAAFEQGRMWPMWRRAPVTG